MCGINGFIDFKNRYGSDERRNIVHCMNECIIRRGPDDEGIYDGDWFSFGMRRLSIIDLETGSQPIYNSDKSIAIVFNGEIYNYKDLKKRLEDRGASFYTNTDTEVIVKLYEAYGIKSFEKLDGMFAFSLYDKREEVIYLVRDKLGEKPLYYANNCDTFLYASELKSIEKTNLIKTDIDKTALDYYFRYTYIPAPLTIYEGVKKLLPGHYMRIEKKRNVDMFQYWDIRSIDKWRNISYEDAKRELRRRLNKSVKRRMNCDVPYGAFLSGGIDSSIVTALMVRNSSKPIDTYTIGFKEKEYDESANAARMAKHLGTNHHEHIISYNDAINVIDDIISNMDEPFADSSAIPEYLVSHFASQEVKVVLTGDGGDEMFLGYDKYLIGYYSDYYMKLPQLVRRRVIEPAIKFMPDKTVLSRKVNKVIKSAYQDSFSRRNQVMELGFKQGEIDRLISPDYKVADDEIDIVKNYYNNAPLTSDLSRTQYTDIKYVLEGDMLAKVDRMAMLNSLETRAPLISSSIIEFAYNLPVEYKLDNRNKKKILKEAFHDVFPKGYDKLPKSGFGIPLDRWFRDEMRDDLEKTLNNDRIKKQGIFNADYIETILSEHMSGKVNRKFELWALYVFEKWCEGEE